MHINETLLRIKTNLKRKILLSVVLTIGIYATYLILQRYHLFPATLLSPTWMDRMVPFVPGAVYLYESIWLLMPIAPWLMTSSTELNRYTRGLVSVSLLGFLIFLFYPTSCPRPNEPHDFNFLYATLIRIDLESNAFPSLHAAFAVFHALCCQSVFSSGRWARKIRGLVWIWAIGIVLATLLTKQHVLVDAVAGTVMGIAGYDFFCHSPKNLRGTQDI